MAPECCKYYPIDTLISPIFTQDADIWSLGCLLSNLIILSVLGEAGRNGYRKQRIKENESMPGGLGGSGYEKGFHKSRRERSECVHQNHKEAIEKCAGRENQRTLEAVSRLVLDHILQPDPGRRLTARELLAEWNTEVQRLTNTTTSQKLPTIHPPVHQESDGKPTQLGPPDPPRERSLEHDIGPQPAPREATKVTVNDFVAWHNSKSKTKLDKQFPELHQELNSLGPFKPRVQSPLKYLTKPAHYPGRNHVSRRTNPDARS